MYLSSIFKTLVKNNCGQGILTLKSTVKFSIFESWCNTPKIIVFAVVKKGIFGLLLAPLQEFS